jgi:hypothetical protein
MEDIRKAMNERNLKESQWEDRKQWSLGVGQRRKKLWNRYTGGPRRNVPEFARVFLMLKYTDVTLNYLYPKLNGYGNNGQRKVWSSCGSTYCTCSADTLPYTAYACPWEFHCCQRCDYVVNG